MTIADGANLPNSVADVSVQFPEDWMLALRRPDVSPVATLHSYLIPYWYRAGQRWVLYDAKPRCLIEDDELQGGLIYGNELIAALEGPPPRDLEAWQRCPYVSDVQHELYRLHKVYARPFWVMQGDHGGHQVKFDPWQQNLLSAQGKPTEPPAIGSLPPCPFDNRVIYQLQRLNRLNQLGNDLERLRNTASVIYAESELQRVQREIREAEMQFIEQQITPLVEVTSQIQKSSAHQDLVVYTKPGAAAMAKDALQEHLETGWFPV